MSRRTPRPLLSIAVLGLLALPTLASGRSPRAPAPPTVEKQAAPAAVKRKAPRGFDLKSIGHVVVIYQENWSFDSLYGQRPDVDGASFGTAVAQVKPDGTAFTSMPPPWDENGHDYTSSKYPVPLPVAFLDLRRFDGPDGGYDDSKETWDVEHRFYPCQLQIDGGKNDRFLFWSALDRDAIAGATGNVNPLVLTGVDATTLPEGEIAAHSLICDRFFQSAFGGSFLNHQYLVAARPPVYVNAATATGSDGKPVSSHFPRTKDGKLDTSGPVKTWDTEFAVGWVPRTTTDVYAVNTMQPTYPPHGSKLWLPPQAHATIGDLISKASVTWKWYSEGWDVANRVANGTATKEEKKEADELGFQVHHQPFNFFKAFDPGTPDGRRNRKAHLADYDALVRALDAQAKLPSVSFVKFAGANNEHPGYADLARGQQHVKDLVEKLQHHPAWQDMVIIITYDENGGRWDHVAPPKVDDFGPGPRVPAIIVSRFVKPGSVYHETCETVSILRLIERRWGLEALTERDKNANDLTSAFTAPAIPVGR